MPPRVSQRCGYTGILFDGVTRVSLRQARKAEIPSAHQIKKRAASDCASDSLLQAKPYAEGNSQIVGAVQPRGVERTHEFVSMIAQQPQQTRDGIITTFAPVVEKVAPSVVTVSTTQTVSRGLTAYPFSDDALRQFFGGRAPQRQGKQTLQGLGSGVIGISSR